MEMEHVMKVTYINHSGFLVETRDCYYIFDYYRGELPHLDKEKEVIVFCSHFHEDHFNPQIFEILDDMGMTYQAVLANDIRKRNHLSDRKITYVYHDQTYNLDNETKVYTLPVSYTHLDVYKRQHRKNMANIIRYVMRFLLHLRISKWYLIKKKRQWTGSFDMEMKHWLHSKSCRWTR